MFCSSLCVGAIRVLYIEFDEENERVLREVLGLVQIVAVLFVYYYAYRLSLLIVEVLRDVIIARTSRTNTKVDDMVAPLVSEALRFVISAVWLLQILSTLGMDTLGATATVSILTLVVGLAAHEYVKCLVGLVVIIFDEPLSVGDFVTMNNITGTIKAFTLRYCILEGANAKVYSIPNSQFLTQTLTNISRRRRIYGSVKFAILANDETTKKIEALRTTLLRHVRSEKEGFVGGVSPSVRLGIADGCVSFHIETWFLQRPTNKSICDTDERAVTPSWSSFVEAEARLVLAIHAATRDLDLRFATPVMTTGSDGAR